MSREYLTKGLSDRIVKAYYEYMVDVAVIYGAERSRAERELLDSLNFEIALANVRVKSIYLNVKPKSIFISNQYLMNFKLFS